jgi:LysM repeat protein
MTEQKNQSRSRLKIAFFVVVGVHVAVVLVALLAQGCKREQPATPPEITTWPDTNVPPEAGATPYGEPATTPPAVEPSTTGPVAPAVTPGVTEYTIERGDTFSSIGKKFGVSTKAIQSANPGVEPTKLKIGQKILIPPPAPEPSLTAPTMGGEQTYTVKSGDTLSAIATRYGTTVKAIRAANNLTTDRINVGQVLKIPAKVEAPAVPVPGSPPAQ